MPTDTLTIRQADANDEDDIRSLTRGAYAEWVPIIDREPLPMSADYKKALEENRFDLLYVNGELAGILETMTKTDHLWIGNIAVSPAFQGKGFGQALLSHADKLAASLGYSEVKLFTNKQFLRSLTFYQKFGYRVDKEEPFMNGICVHMSKSL